MAQMVFEVPDTVANLPEPERDRLIRAGLYEAARARIRQLEDELAESELHLRRFETRYQVSFDRFEVELLPTLDTPQVHEDYNDWLYWQQVQQEKLRLLNEVRWVKPE